ncbi:3'(2'),5'-bisphosphate nucleotidase [Neophaeococcomyces mojaviensis]|uniref:3'(2'),5'-bisphosphate nucleotidase n=1 Tax=Neophaeococcomyces mojaviensis TaxID=3383035 RepID=A0ACC2ZXH2_9EURO|nr:3'(2'),5'-bisphosphate nucleotidase [Knufia sp. JES_112]
MRRLTNLDLKSYLFLSCAIAILFSAVILAPTGHHLQFFTRPASRAASILAHVQKSPHYLGAVKNTKSVSVGRNGVHSTSRNADESINSLTSKMAYEKELKVAQLAVARASILTKSVFAEKAKGTISKEDKSPVTIGDYGAQALIIAAIKHNFPSDEVVGEEEASSLREQKDLSSKIWTLVKDTKLEDAESDKLLGGPIESEEKMLEAIDAGSSAGGNKGRIWALDPIDGTKGFLRGGQYAVCLALMVDGDVKVGVLGCPNLPVDDSVALTEDIGVAASDKEGFGVLFSAVQGEGARSQPLTRGAVSEGHAISVKKITDVSQAVMCESVEPGHSSKGDNALIAEKLGISGKPVQMDSQAKYGSVARGAGDVYLRLPVRKDYQEKIWDHAAGDLIVREAGGQVTDIHGKRLNFSLGRTLDENKGVIATPANIHPQVLKAVGEVLTAK